MENNSINITGESSNVQIQQNISNPQIINEKFDYDKILEVIKEISKYESGFKEAYGNKNEQAQKALTNAKEAAENKEDPSKVEGFLNILKDISIKAVDGLISKGVLSLLDKLGI